MRQLEARYHVQILAVYRKCDWIDCPGASRMVVGQRAVVSIEHNRSFTSRRNRHNWQMDSGFTLYSTVLLMGAAHGLFLALALLNARGGNLVAHRLLAALTLVFAMDLGEDFLDESHYFTLVPFLLGIVYPLDFLYGPLTFLYVSALTTPGEFRLAGKQWLHFLPCATGYLLLIPYFTLDADVKLNQFYGDIDAKTWHLALAQIGEAVVVLVSIVQIGVYLVLSIRKQVRHAGSIRHQFSYTERISLTWVRNLLVGLSTLYLIYFVATSVSLTIGFIDEIYDLLMLLIVMMIYTMGYLGLRQPAIFARLEADPVNTELQEEVEATSEQLNPLSALREKYKKSALDQDMSEALLVELQSYMEVNKPYLDGALTLPQLAEQLGISPNYLSQIINEQLGQNFFDYINRYRVEEVKDYLSDPAREQTGILAMAFDAGFNSKSAFNVAFKKHTAMTPSQFKKRITG